jgi:hypothetical protein
VVSTTTTPIQFIDIVRDGGKFHSCFQHHDDIHETRSGFVYRIVTTKWIYHITLFEIMLSTISTT